MQLQQRLYTPAEYLELEEKAEFKSEYRDGEIVAMAGGTMNHNLIAGNLFAALKFGLRGKDYIVCIGDVRLSTPSSRQYTYPDVMVIQGAPIYSEKNTTTVTNPCIIIEVLSKSTKNYDRGDKFDYYRSIPSLQEYILVDQSGYHLIQYVKTAETQWLLTDYYDADAILKMATVDCAIALSDIYDRVNFNEIEE
jgi:Uma2 family endonuclease